LAVSSSKAKMVPMAQRQWKFFDSVVILTVDVSAGVWVTCQLTQCWRW